MKSALVIGASGLLGGKLVDVLSKEYEVVPTHNTQALHPNSIRLNIVDDVQVFRVLREVCPDVVVHAAAETNVDKCETDKEWAWRVNVASTKNIAEACVMNDARLIYVSTDYVFDGHKGLYSEEDEANPINYYGLTKLRGEEFVKDLCEDFLIARTSVLYGWHTRRLNFATWVIDSLKNRRGIPVALDLYGSPTLADDLAEIFRKILGNKVGGVYHVAGGERVSRYEFALKIAETFELDSSLVAPVKMESLKAWIARRPRDSSLCVDKLKEDTGIQPLDLATALERMKESELR